MKWRDQAAPIIARVLRETAGKSDKEIRDALKKAYPFGRREFFPYKVWLDEIKAQRGLKQKPQKPKVETDDPDQCKFTWEKP